MDRSERTLTGSQHDYSRYFRWALDELRSEHLYRVFADIERLAGRYPQAIWHAPDGPRPITVWCSNDYLGMGQNPGRDRAPWIEAAWRLGTGAGGTRNISGTSHPIVALEARARRSPRQGSGPRLHLGLRLERDRHLDAREAAPELPDPLGRAQPQLDDRGRAPVGLRQGDLPPQRSRRIWRTCSRPPASGPSSSSSRASIPWTATSPRSMPSATSPSATAP